MRTQKIHLFTVTGIKVFYEKRSSCVCKAECLYATASDPDSMAYLRSVLSSLDILNCKSVNYSFWTYAGLLEGRLQDDQKVLKGRLSFIINLRKRKRENGTEALFKWIFRNKGVCFWGAGQWCKAVLASKGMHSICMITDVDLKHVILDESITLTADTADSPNPESSIMCHGRAARMVEPTNATPLAGMPRMEKRQKE